VDEELETVASCGLIAKRDHLPEFPRGVDVKEGKWWRRRKEGLERQVQHDGAVFSDRIEHDRPLRLRHNLAQNVNALGFKPLKVRQSGGCGSERTG
jgi:hypothetical protein